VSLKKFFLQWEPGRLAGLISC